MNRGRIGIYCFAALRALREFPIRAKRLYVVASAENVAFRVFADRKNASYLLRLHRPGYHDLSELNSERVWVRALGAVGIAVPSPICAQDGREYVPVYVPTTGETRYASLAQWQEGELAAKVLKERDGVEHYAARLGSLMASMHNQASRWVPPGDFKRRLLDGDGLMGPDPFWGRFWEEETLTSDERHLLVDTRDAIRGALCRYGCDPITFSMIHADMHQSNVLVHGDHLTVIDFDDASFGWHQYDIAVALFDAEQRRTNLAKFENAFLGSYRSVRVVTNEALALLPMFRLVRGMALIGWKHQRPEVEWPEGKLERIKITVLKQCRELEVPC